MSIKQRIIFLVCLVLFQLLHVISTVWFLVAILVNAQPRCRKIALSYDQLGNATMGNDEDETISSMLGRKGKPVWLVKFVDWLFFELYGEVSHSKSKVEPRFK